MNLSTTTYNLSPTFSDTAKLKMDGHSSASALFKQKLASRRQKEEQAGYRKPCTYSSPSVQKRSLKPTTAGAGKTISGRVVEKVDCCLNDSEISLQSDFLFSPTTKPSLDGSIGDLSKVSIKSTKSAQTYSHPSDGRQKKCNHFFQRLGLTHFFGKGAQNSNPQVSPKKESRRLRGIAQKQRRQQSEANKLNKEEKELHVIIDGVLKEYPKHLCCNFDDHYEFALAELTTKHSQEIQMTQENFHHLKDLLKTKLRDSMMVDETTVASFDGHNSIRSSTSMPARLPIYRQRHSTRLDVPPFKTKPKKSCTRIVGSSEIAPDLKKKEDDEATATTFNSSATFDEDLAASDSMVNTEPIIVENLLILDSDGHLGKYTGPISRKTGKPHGMRGRLIDQTEIGQMYEGGWDQGQRSGYGRLVHANGDMYVGYFLDDKKHGNGVYRYQDGKRRFEGRYIMGNRVEGTMVYGDSSVYKGQWYQEKRHGRGKYTFCDGGEYKGEFVEDQIHGRGHLLWPDGSKYVGEWSRGQRHGHGKEYGPDRKLRHEGVWKHGKPSL